MAQQFSVAVRNARGDVYESTIGAGAKLKIFSGAPPANCAAANSGTELAHMDLPSDWMTAASGGAKGKSGTWEDLAANAAGTAGHFRIYDNAGTTCHHQGTVSGPSGGGDMEVQNTNFAVGQKVTVTQFDLTEGGA